MARANLIFLLLALAFGGCDSSPEKKAAIEQMQHKHDQWVETMGGAGL